MLGLISEVLRAPILLLSCLDEFSRPDLSKVGWNAEFQTERLRSY